VDAFSNDTSSPAVRENPTPPRNPGHGTLNDPFRPDTGQRQRERPSP